MNKTLGKISERLSKFKDQLEKAHLSTKKVPNLTDSADIDDSRKMIESKHMNGANVGQYNHEGEKVVHARAKSAHNLSKDSPEEPDMASPSEPKGLEGKRKPVTHDECGRPFGKDEEYEQEVDSKVADIKSKAKVAEMKDDPFKANVRIAERDAKMAKDDVDEKIKARIRAEMDKRKFGEADATKHVIDRDRGEKMAQQPKPKKDPLFQTEMVKFDSKGQWSIEKSNYGPKGAGLYNPNDNAKRKEGNTGESFSDIGQNKNVKRYTTPGSSMQAASEANTAKEQKAKTKASTKIYTDEEKAALMGQYKKEGKL
jgi:hypothetical protein